MNEIYYSNGSLGSPRGFYVTTDNGPRAVRLFARADGVVCIEPVARPQAIEVTINAMHFEDQTADPVLVAEAVREVIQEHQGD